MPAGHIINNNHIFFLCINNDNTVLSTVPILGQKTLLEINFRKFEIKHAKLETNLMQ